MYHVGVLHCVLQCVAVGVLHCELHCVAVTWDIGAVYHVGVLHYAHGYVVWGCYSLHTGRSWRGGVLHKGEEGCYTKGSCVEVT